MIESNVDQKLTATDFSLMDNKSLNWILIIILKAMDTY